MAIEYICDSGEPVTLLPASTVIETVVEDVWTGLVNEHGDRIFRREVKEPFGFVCADKR